MTVSYPSVGLKRVAALGTGHTPSRANAEYWLDCTIPWLTLADVGPLRDGTVAVITETKEKISELGVANSSAVIHPAGTVVMSRTASVGYSGILGMDMATSQDYVTWTCGPRIEPRFLLHSLRGLRNEILASRMGSTHQTIYMPDVERIRVPLPPVDEQRRIAEFLDAETARIDALITAKRRMIEVASLRYASTVAADTSFLAHQPLKRLAAIVDCKHRTPTYVPVGYPVVSPGDVTPGPLDLERCHRFVADDDWIDLTEGPRRPRLGDIVYSRNASVGLAGLVVNPRFCMGQDVCLIRTSRPDGDGRYLMHVLNTVGLDQIDQLKVGSTFFRVNVAQIADLRIPATDEATEEQLTERWDAAVERLNSLTATLTRQIELLRERRQALITAAVSGELTV